MLKIFLRNTLLAMSMAAHPVPQAMAAEKAADPAYKVGDRLAPDAKPKADNGAYQELKWDALMPNDWQPYKALQGLSLRMMGDGDPRAIEAMARLRLEWQSAPVNAELNGTRARIAGFVVPLELEKGAIREFLLVPYFGACIHTPPPPTNQIIHVVAAKPLKSTGMMAAVWVSGTLKVDRVDTSMGSSGYQMSGDLVEAYDDSKRSR